MSAADPEFDALVAEGEAAPIVGWDFSWLEGRATEERPSWGYARMVAARLPGGRRAARRRNRRRRDARERRGPAVAERRDRAVAAQRVGRGEPAARSERARRRGRRTGAAVPRWGVRPRHQPPPAGDVLARDRPRAASGRRVPVAADRRSRRRGARRRHPRPAPISLAGPGAWPRARARRRGSER